MNTNVCLSPSRPLLPYFGGKWRIAKWCVSHFPKHTTYVEPFAGAASCLLRKPRSEGEVLNDLNTEIVGLFRVLRNEEQAARLIPLLCSTPYARTEYEAAYEPFDCPVEQARRTLLRFHSAFACDCQIPGRKTGFKVALDGQHSRAWASFPDALRRIIDRLAGVTIENMDAKKVITRFDSRDTLFFIDPPYLAETRSSRRVYQHEMTNAQHEQLAQVLQSVSGMVVLAGYPSPLYDALYPDWTQVTRKNRTCVNGERTESLWLSPRTVTALKETNTCVFPSLSSS